MSLKYEVKVSKIAVVLAFLRHNQLHRIHSPAQFWRSGSYYWWQYGKSLDESKIRSLL